MKEILLVALVSTVLCGCTSKPVAKTTEHRVEPATANAYNSFVNRRTAELQQMGGPFKDRGAANTKAQDDAISRFGGVAQDTVTTTWSSSNAQAQAEFTAKLDDLAKKAKER